MRITKLKTINRIKIYDNEGVPKVELYFSKLHF